VLGTTGGRLARIIPHSSQEEQRLKARLTLLRLVRRELYALKNSLVMTPTRSMHRVWDIGLYPQPASVAVLKGLWLHEHQTLTESWLRMLRSQSAETVEAWQPLRRKELAQAVERERLNSISRFYTGRELQKLLHSRTPAPQSPQLYSNIPGTIVVTTGDARGRDAFVAGLSYGYTLAPEAHNSTRIADLSHADLGMALSLAEERGLTTQLVHGPKPLVTSVSSRLCAWEFGLTWPTRR
jgi:hypothetical protein